MVRDKVSPSRTVSASLCAVKKLKLSGSGSLTPTDECRNCNTFTHEVVWRLTGRRAPAWLNRAAWVRTHGPTLALLHAHNRIDRLLRCQVATAIPCIVPAGWIDDADEAAPTAADSDSHSQAQAHIPDPGHLLSGSDTVTIAPPRADRMSASGRE
jgi:hypothetical protein